MLIGTRRLDLSHNFAGAMPSLHSLKIMFPNLIELNLSENQLKTIEAPDLVKCLPKLEIINVSHNRLVNFEEVHVLDKLVRLRNLDIRDNPNLSLSQMTRVAQLSSLIMRDAGVDRASPGAYQRALMARYANDAEELKENSFVRFTTSIFKG